MEPEGSLPSLPVPATCPYPEPDQSSPYPLPPHPTSLISLCSLNVLSLPDFNFFLQDIIVRLEVARIGVFCLRQDYAFISVAIILF
jgi:hypothetical protein